MKLIIVESPTKAKTIKKFLGSSYKVESSFGHVKDLPKSKMGIDIENNFAPHYIVPTKAKKTVSLLKKLALNSDEVILASDEDREGEAISWHLAAALNLDLDKTKRIVFHEITKDAILKALKNPGKINQAMVDAQQARRVLDRLVGYELSPFLWKKVAKGLSAGRVQSVATKMIVEREKEIQAFKSEDYASLTAEFKKEDISFNTDLAKINSKPFGKLGLKKEQAIEIKKAIKKSPFTVTKLSKKESKKNPSPPFITSTLQQSANRNLGFSAKQTMSVAQKLYEQGFITYMRTDSLNLSEKFLTDSRVWIKDTLDKKYLPSQALTYKVKNKNSQEAHEAIRPTEVSNLPENLESKLERNQFKLYQLIWQKAVASQMTSAEISTTSIEFSVNSNKNKDVYIFKTSGQIITFPGYLKVWPEKTKEQALPVVEEAETLEALSLKVNEHSTNPPARFSDASLVKEMEKYGIGRPSTYAPTINTIINRNYAIRDENKKLKPSDIAFVVSDLLSAHFPRIIDYGFTAALENNLDDIAAGTKEWQPVISEFYTDFHSNLEKKYEEINKQDIMPEIETTEKCDKCGAAMVMKTSRFGKFLACSAFPECRNIKKEEAAPGSPEAEVDQALKDLEKKHKDEVCSKCGSPMNVKNGKFGPFLACSAYPKCKNIKNINSDGGPEVACPICDQGKIVKKFSRRGVFYACDNYPQCKNAYWGKPTGEKCKKCGGLMIEDLKTKKIKCSNKDCSKKGKVLE